MKKALILGLSLVLVVGAGVLIMKNSHTPVQAQNTNSSEIVYDVKTLFVSDTVAAVSWKVHQASIGTVQYGTASGNYTLPESACSMLIQVPSSEQLIWRKLDNLSPNTTYYYRIKATDEAGNVLGYSEEKTFKTNAEATKINYVAPNTGWEGLEITIMGTGFGEYSSDSMPTAAVNIGNKNISLCPHGNATITSWSNGKITATLNDPEDPVCGPKTGAVNIYRTILAGYCYTIPSGVAVLDVNGPNLTISDPPKITNISPTSGPVDTKVTINGTNFREDCGGGHACNMWVFFGNGYLTNHGIGIESWTNEKIEVIVPHDATTGPIRISMYNDSNSIDPGGDIIQYDITGPTFTVTTPTVTNTNTAANINTATNLNANVAVNTNTASGGQNVQNAYGCDFSTTIQNETTVKVKSLFKKDSDTDQYFHDVYNAYFDAWKRYPRCDEMQFQYDHSTTIERLRSWLQENASQTQTGDDYMQAADIKLVESNNVITQEEAATKLEFKKGNNITLSGIATPNSKVVITVSSETKVYTTNTNNEGYWTYTITDTLDTGSHSAQVAVYDKNDVKISESQAITFSIISAAKAAETTTTEEKDNTVIYLIIALGLALLIILIIFLASKKKPKPSPTEKKK